MMDIGANDSSMGTAAQLALAWAPSGLLKGNEAAPVALACFALAVLLAWYWLSLPRKRDGAATQPLSKASASPAGKFRFELESLPLLKASDAEMDWFEGVMQEIYEVRFGAKNWGDVGGEAIKGWPPKAFRAALLQLRERVPEPYQGGTVHEPIDDAMLSRLLIVSNLNVDAAAALVSRYVAYRQDVQGGTGPLLKNLQAGLAVVPCEDCQGRPVLFVRLRYHKAYDLEMFRTGVRALLDTIVMHLLLKREASISRQNPLEQYIMVLDMANATMSNFDWSGFKVLLHEGVTNYPNRLAQIYVLGANAFARWAYGLMSPLLHPRTRRKCIMVAAKDVNACLHDLIPSAVLPPQYGGSGNSCPAPQEACTLQDQVGDIAAAVLLRTGMVPSGALPDRHSKPSSQLAGKTHHPGWSDNRRRKPEAPGIFSCCTSRA
eukprot:TRINITY_DN80911_c0_g1_i1.p1 TRINITY_DN80911_c0_g1~~TRINITY_DN80911_c0_g1_i1.p1  ORF type:complete len:433 (+),score=68.85 TRINITY_DN80911_c0_g1_i1:52-1350(+)